MANNRRANGPNGNNQDEGGSWWKTIGTGVGVALAAAAAGTGLYLYSGSGQQEANRSANSDSSGSDSPRRTDVRDARVEDTTESSDSLSIRRMDTPNFNGCRRGVPRGNIPKNPVINNLNSLLDDIYLRYVALNDEDFDMYYRVFTDVFRQIHMKMKEANAYYERYSSTIVVAGSHYDRVRIQKPDEFDVDIVIGLPLNMRVHRSNPEDSDIVLEPKEAGFAQLRMGTQYKRLMMRDGNNWQINKDAYEWSDDQDYLLRSKFMDWFKKVVDKVLNLFDQGPTPIIYSGGVPYTVRKSESGPARTLYIENRSRGFKLDIDLVPALKFPEERWPITSTYRQIRDNWSNPENIWLLVPKPNKNANNTHDTNRSWRIGLHIQERKLMYNTGNLRQVLKLLKKLRDAQEMNKIASYYLKTLVLWEVIKRENVPGFWNQNLAALFKILVRKFYNALVAGRIPYFWNKNNNLIANISPMVLHGYATKLECLLAVLDNPSSYKHVAKYLLDPFEFREYNDNFLHI